MRTNTPTRGATTKLRTHEGAAAVAITPELELRRAVMANMLWEDTFYESGVEIGKRIMDLVRKVDPITVAEISVEAREQMKLRHVPLLLVRELARRRSEMVKSRTDETKEAGLNIPVADVLARIIQRPDELTEFVSMYWKDGKQPLSGQVKKGLSRAFSKFDEYQLAKYNRVDPVKLRDVLFLSHAVPRSTEGTRYGMSREDREKLFKKLIGGFCANCWKPMNREVTGKAQDRVLRGAKAFTSKSEEKRIAHQICTCASPVEAKLATPDTWEVALSAGKDKRETFERMLRENTLGALALLRNLRNMQQSGVPDAVIREGLKNMKTERVLPFRFISAAKYAPQFEPELETAMFRSLTEHEKLTGRTILLVDNSGSMYGGTVSKKSELTPSDAACALAMLLREICEDVKVFAFSGQPSLVPPRRGFALRDAIIRATEHGGTYTENAKRSADAAGYDRLIIVTDEQSHQSLSKPLKDKAYVINVQPNQNGIGYGDWIHVDGWSENIVDYILRFETAGVR